MTAEERHGDRASSGTERRRVCVVVKNPIERLPPALSVGGALPRAGMETTVVCASVGAGTRALLESSGARVVDLGLGGLPPERVWGKVVYWARFRSRAWSAIDALPSSTLLWVGSVDTALALGRRLLGRSYVLQCNELYDRQWRYRLAMGRYLRRSATVVVPEPNRAAILRSWFGLPATPAVLPNKPLFHPRVPTPLDEVGLAADVAATIRSGVRLVLYQGYLSQDRDIVPVARAVRELGEDWRFMVMGHDQGALHDIRIACPDVIHVPYRPAPEHLKVTGLARIGVLAYDYSSLNNVFCAPNKIWEYSGFGIPILGQDLPGIRTWLGPAGAGLCVDFGVEGAAGRALSTLDANHSRYTAAAKFLFDSSDLVDNVKHAVDRASGSLR